MIDAKEVECLLKQWQEKKEMFTGNAEVLKTKAYYGRMAEAERDVAELIVKDLEELLLNAKSSCVIHLQWSGPYTWTEKNKLNGPEDFGVYQIYGCHPKAPQLLPAFRVLHVSVVVIGPLLSLLQYTDFIPAKGIPDAFNVVR